MRFSYFLYKYILTFLICTIVTSAAYLPKRHHKKSSKPKITNSIQKHENMPNINSLQGLVNAIASRTKQITGSFGFYATSLTSGQVIANSSGQESFQPASNMKLYTTAAALDKLGLDFRIRTSVYCVAPDSSGNIEGDLILYGRGDPSLSSRFNPNKGDNAITPLEFLANQVKASGAKQVSGNLLADESYFRAAPLGNGWEWKDLQWHYGTEISSLSVADNQLTIFVTPGSKLGDSCFINIEPMTPLVKIINHTITSSRRTKQKIGIHRGLADNTIEVWGNLPIGKGMSASLAIHNPALFAGYLFKEMLLRRGINVKGQIKQVDANLRQYEPLDLSRLKEIAFVESRALGELIQVINKHSQNLHTELLLRQLGKLYGAQEIDSDQAGIEVVKGFLKRAGLNLTELQVYDGSGLSRLDYVAPESTVKLLSFMYKHPHSSVYRDSLPVAGVDGTLAGRMNKTKAENNLRAKTGTLDDVSALSGYVTTGDGQELVFSLMFNKLNSSRTYGVAMGNVLGEVMANYPAFPKNLKKLPR